MHDPDPPITSRLRKGLAAAFGTALPLFALTVFLVLLAEVRLERRDPEPLDVPRLAGLDLAPPRDPLGSAEIEGVVLDPSGAAVPDALVVARSGEVPAWRYTDERGHFRLRGLTPGPLSVHVLSNSFRAQEFSLFAPEAEARLVLAEPFDPLPDLPPLEQAPLTGEVVPPWPQWAPAGYEVALLPVAAPDTFGAPLPRRTRVALDRSFEFEDLLAGEYRVLVLPPWARGTDRPNLLALSQRRFTHRAGGTPKPLVLRMEAGAVEGRAIDPAGEPVTDALVLVHLVEHPEDPWPPARTDAQGALRVLDLVPGDYVVEVLAGAGRVETRVSILPGVTARIDLPPLDPRGE